MIPNFYKLHIVNNTGAQIDFGTDGPNNSFVITAVGWNFNSSGVLVYGSQQTIFADPTVDLADLASVEAAADTFNKFPQRLLCSNLRTTEKQMICL